jgi:hypothetical protein
MARRRCMAGELNVPKSKSLLFVKILLLVPTFADG